MLNEIILGVLLIVTLVLVVMLIRFFQVIGKNPEPIPQKESKPDEETDEHTA